MRSHECIKTCIESIKVNKKYCTDTWYKLCTIICTSICSVLFINTISSMEIGNYSHTQSVYIACEIASHVQPH